MGFVILATAGYDHIIRFWDAQSGKCYRALQHKESQINRLEISPDKKYIAAAANPVLKLFEVRSNNPNAALSFTGHTGNVTSVGFNKDGKWLFTASEDSTVKIWDVMGASSAQQEFKFSAAVTSAVLHPNQAEIVCGLQDGSMRVIDLVSNKVTRILGPDPESSIRSVSVSANGRFLACCNSSGTLYAWDSPQTNCKELVSVAKLQAHESYVLRCSFSPNSALLATTSADQSVKIWSTTNFSCEKTLLGHQQWIWDAAWSADSAFLLTGASDKTARLWDISQGEAVRQYTGHGKIVSAVALSDSTDAPLSQ